MPNLLGNLATFGNAIACGFYDLTHSPEKTVEHDGNGVPVAWRLFAFGPFSITRSGETLQGEFTPEAAEQILAHFQAKGSKIPLDSEHFLFQLAEKMGVPEYEIRNLIPDGRGTFGFASLEIRPDGLWVAQVEYVPLARQLMAEGIFRYFSPVIRGLSDGRLRITSVAFTNTPAIDQLESLAAMAEAPPAHPNVDALAASINGILPRNHSSKPNNKEPRMNQLLVLLAPLLAVDSIALSDDGTVPDDIAAKITALGQEIPTLRAATEGQTAFLAATKDALALSDDATLATAQAAILGLKASADQATALKTRVDALELSAEQSDLAKVMEQGKTEGKLTKAMIEGDWGKGLDAAALTAFLKTAPVVVEPGEIPKQDLASPDALPLTADGEKINHLLGVTQDQVTAANK